MIAEKRPRPRKRERKGPAAERGGEVRDRCRQRALIYPISFRETGPFLPPRSAGEDEFQQILYSAFEQKRCVTQVALFQGKELERGFFVTDVTEPERLAVVVLERLPVGQFFLPPVVLPDPG